MNYGLSKSRGKFMTKKTLTLVFQIFLIVLTLLFNYSDFSLTGVSQNNQTENYYPHLIGKSRIGIAYDVYVDNGYAYVTTNYDLVIVDVQNPKRPKKMSTIKVDGGVFGVRVRDNIAYIATDDSHEFLIADVSDSKEPLVIGRYQAEDELRKVRLDGNYAYIVSVNEGLLIFDIQDSSNPTLVSQFNEGGFSTCVAISGDIAYLTDNNDGLHILDISNKSEPIEIAFLAENYGAFDVEIYGDILYMACYAYGVRLINVTDPFNPAVISSHGNYELKRSRALSGDSNFLYLAEMEKGIKLLNVTDPSNPIELSAYTDSKPINCYYDGKYVYITESRNNKGFRIVEFTTEPPSFNKQYLWYLLFTIPFLIIIPIIYRFRFMKKTNS